MTDATLDTVNAATVGTIEIGYAGTGAGGQTGLVTISNSGVALTPVTNLTVQAQGTSAAGISMVDGITTPSKSVTLNGAVALANNIAINTTSSGTGAAVTFAGTVDGNKTLGITAGTTGNVVFTGLVGNTTPVGAITINSANNVTTNGVRAASFVQTTGSGTTTLNAAATFGTGNPTEAMNTSAVAGVNINANSIVVNEQVSTNGNNIVLVGGTGVTHSAAGSLTTTGTGAITVTATTGDVTMADGTVYSTGSGAVNVTAGTNVKLGQITTTSSAVNVTATAGAITDNTALETANITGTTATLSAATGIGSAGGTANINTTVGTLIATNSGPTGNIVIAETDALVIRNAAQTNVGTSAGNINITAAGNVTVEATGTGGTGVTIDGTTVSTGTITLAATGNGSSLGVANNVTSKAGNITLNGGDNVTFTAAARVASTTGNIAVVGNFGAGDTVGAITMTDGSTINAGSGTITMSALRDVALTGLTTTNNTTAAVSITSTAGAILDAGDTNTDIVALDANARVTLTAVDLIGRVKGDDVIVNPTGALFGAASRAEGASSTAGNALDTKVRNLDAVITAAGGEIAIDNTAGASITLGSAANLLVPATGQPASMWVRNNQSITVSNWTIDSNDKVALIATAGNVTIPATAINVGRDTDGGTIRLEAALAGQDVSMAGGNLNAITAKNFVLKSGASETLTAMNVANADIAIAGAANTLTFTQNAGAAAALNANDITFKDLDADGMSILTDKGTVSITQQHSNSNITFNDTVNLNRVGTSNGAGDLAVTVLSTAAGAAPLTNPGGGYASTDGTDNKGGVVIATGANVSLDGRTSAVKNGTLYVEGRFNNNGTLNVTTGKSATFIAPAADITFTGSNTSAGNTTLTAGSTNDVIFVPGSTLSVISAGAGTGNLTITGADQVILQAASGPSAAASVNVAGTMTVSNTYALEMQTGTSITVGANGAVSGGDSFVASTGIGAVNMLGTASISAPGSVLIKGTSGITRTVGSTDATGSVALPAVSTGNVTLATLTVDSNGDGIIQGGLGNARLAIEGTGITLNGAIAAGPTGGATGTLVAYFGATTGGITIGTGETFTNFAGAVLESTTGDIGSSANSFRIGTTGNTVTASDRSKVAALSTGGSIYIRDVKTGTTDNGLEIASNLTVRNVAGVDKTTSGVTVSGGSGKEIIVTASSPLVVNADVVNNSGGSITLAAEGNQLTDNLTLNANVTATGGNGAINGAINLFAGNTVNLNSNATVSAAGTGVVTVAAGYNYNAGTPANGNVAMAATSSLLSQGGNINVSAPGNISVATINANNGGTATVGNVTINAAYTGPTGGLAATGAISDALPAEAANIVGKIVTLNAVNGIGSADNINVTAAVLNASNANVVAGSPTADVWIATSGATAVGVITATGQKVRLDAGGALTDNDAGTANNVTATSLEITGNQAVTSIETTVSSLKLATAATSINNTGAVTLQTSVVSDSLALTATGTIDSAANSNIGVTNNASFTTTGGGNSINIGNASGDVFKTGTLTFNSAGTVSIAEDDATRVTGTNTASVLTLASLGALDNAANASITTAGLSTLSGTSINIGNAATDVFNTGTLNFNSAGTVSISEDSATTVVGTNTANVLTLASLGALDNAAAASITTAGLSTLSGTSINIGNAATDVFNTGTLNFNSAGAVNIAEDSNMLVTGVNTAGALTLSTTGNMNSTAGTPAAMRITALSANLLAGGTIGGYNRGDTTKTTLGGVNYNSFGFLDVSRGAITVRADGIDANNVSVDIVGSSIDGLLRLTPPNVPIGAVLFNGFSVTPPPFVKGVTPLAGPAALATALRTGSTGNGDAMSMGSISTTDFLVTKAFPTESVRNQITAGATTVNMLGSIVTLQGIGVNVRPDVESAFQRQAVLDEKRRSATKR